MSKREKYILFTVLSGTILLTAVLSGCGRGDSEVLVTIGREKMTVGDFNENISNLPGRLRSVVTKRKEDYINKLVNDELLYQEALRSGIKKDKEVQAVIKQAEKKILIARLVQEKVDNAIEITDDEIAEDYVRNKGLYMTPEILRVSHILVPTQEEAEVLLGEIRAGASFEDVARAKSVDPTAQRGGDIGYFPRGQLMPEFEAPFADLEVGDISDVVKTRLGYHIIKLTDRKSPEVRPLEQVRDSIKARLYNLKRQEVFDSMLEDLKKKTKVRINEQALQRAGESEGDEDK